MITHYTAIVAITSFAMLTMLAAAQCNIFLRQSKRIRFQLLFICLMLANVLEYISATVMGNPAFRTLFIATKAAELTISPVIPFLAAAAVSSKKGFKTMLIPIGMNVALQVLSLFTGVVFRVDEAGQYQHQRGSMYFIYVALFAWGFVLLILHCIELCRQYQNANLPLLIMILVLVLFAIILQLFVSYLRLDWVCISISAILYYVYYEQLIQQTDGLTQLLNRRSFDCKMENLKKPAAILFFDVDKFKMINDTYGHMFGDECLQKTSESIKRIFGKLGSCYRFGGDEFCVVLTENLYNTEALIEQFRAEIRDCQSVDTSHPGVSVGYEMFDPAKDLIADVITRADKRMYLSKSKHGQSD